VEKVMTYDRDDVAVISPDVFYDNSREDWREVAIGARRQSLVSAGTQREQLRREIRETLEPIDTDDCPPNRLLSLCHISGHFVFMEVNRHFNTITYYDSLVEKDSPSTVPEERIEMMNLIMGVRDDGYVPYDMIRGESAIQADSVSCGLFSLVNMHACLHGAAPPTHISDNMLQRLRCFIFKVLFKPSILLRELQKLKFNKPELVDSEWLESFAAEAVIRQEEY
jgi:hypothetical protein